MPQRTVDYQLNDTIFRVAYGDITQIKLDALVSSDDNYLTMGGGVSLALLRAGGDIIQRDARKHIPLNIGDVVVTSAGQLPAKYIFHAVTIDFDRMIYADEAHIKTATLRCLQLVDVLRLRSIAFPALGTGSARFPFQLAAENMTRTIADYLTGDTGIELVTLTLLAREMVTEDDLNLFYERAVALASIATQGKRLNTLMTELQNIVERMGKPDLTRNVVDLQSKLAYAQSVLAEHSTDVQQLDELEERSKIAQLSQQAIEISSQTQETITFNNYQLEADVLRTKLSGLLTQLNIHYSNLNKLEVKKAKYGPIDVPLSLENAIEELQAEINETELRVQEVRKQLASLTVK